MNQCVPSWDLDENPAMAPRLTPRAYSNSSTASLDYEVAELTWKNGQLAMHGLGLPRVVNKPPTTWDKPRSGGTLESIVDQATYSTLKSAGEGCAINSNELVPWFNHHPRSMVNPAPSGSLTVTMDALVPCSNNNINDCSRQSMNVLDSAPAGTCMVGCSTGVGSCNTAAGGGMRGGRVPRLEISGCKTDLSLSESATCGGTDSRFVTFDDTCELGGAGSASPSPENSSGKEYSKTSADDSVCHRRSSQRKGRHHDEESKKKLLGVGKFSISTKRGRAAAIHNQSERKRRDKINQRMKTLQKMVPNSSKTDKASMLDEVIEYLKQLQAQVQMMSRMSMPPMMLPLAMQQQLQMSMMGMQMGMGMGMGMGVMDMNTMSRAAGMPQMLPGDRLPGPPSGPSLMHDPLTALLACQSQQPMNMDAYSRLAAMYQQFQQNPGSAPKHY